MIVIEQAVYFLSRRINSLFVLRKDDIIYRPPYQNILAPVSNVVTSIEISITYIITFCAFLFMLNLLTIIPTLPRYLRTVTLPL